MKARLINWDEAARRITVIVDMSHFLFFKESRHVFGTYFLIHGPGNNGKSLNLGTWYFDDTKLPVDHAVSTFLDAYMRGCATQKGLIG